VVVIRLAIQLDAPFAERYAAAAKRVRGVQVVDEWSDAEAVLTTRAEDAEGRHLLLIPTLENVRDVKERGVVMPAAEWRFRPAIQAIHRRLKAGHLGEPGLLRIHRWGVEAELLADVDLAFWIFGVPIATHVMTQSDTGYRQVHFGFKEGGMALIDHAPLPTANPDGYESVSLIGSAGAAHADDHRNINLLLKSDQTTALRVGEGESARVSLLAEFVAAIVEKRNPSVTMRDLAEASDLVLHHTE
jgi:predicted dehydrogenase